MRHLLCFAFALCACKGSSSSGPPASVRFLPPDPELAMRIDVAKVRGWSIYDKLAPAALVSVSTVLDAAKSKCNLDVMGTATTILVAKKGSLLDGDVTLVASGLPRDKVTQCLDTVASAKSIFELTRDADVFHAKLQGKPIASGAILPSGEVVVVARKGAGIDPAAWKTEVTQGATAVPAWWSELEPYLASPIVVRTTDDKRTVLASATFSDALTLRAKVVTKSDADAKDDAKRIDAILQYLKSANAGEGKTDTQGASAFAELVAKGPQLDALIKTGGAALFAPAGGIPTEPATASRHYECSELAQAVTDYMTAALQSAGNSPQMADMVTKVTPPLAKAYVDACTQGAWADAAIECHVLNATNLPKFEKCRIQLTEAQRGPFDKAVADVLATVQPHAPASGSGSGSGSGSAAK